jgi:alpha,alpha-trehalase
MESGADNNVAALNFPEKTVAGADVNAFMFREFIALSKIAQLLGNSAVADAYQRKATSLQERINALLWSSDDQIYYNLDTRAGTHIRRVSYSSFVPLWADIPSAEQAAATIQRYMLSPQHLFSKAGIRSLSKADPEYNNENIIKPHSNWQGPMWPIANYLHAQGMARYGFGGEALEVARRVLQCLLTDIEKGGGMHENYDAETAEPLAAPNFISWNLVMRNVVEEILEKRDPFAL